MPGFKRDDLAGYLAACERAHERAAAMRAAAARGDAYALRQAAASLPCYGRTLERDGSRPLSRNGKRDMAAAVRAGVISGDTGRQHGPDTPAPRTIPGTPRHA